MAEAAGSSPIQEQLRELNKQCAEWRGLWKDAKDNQDEAFARKRLEDLDARRKNLEDKLTGRVA